MTPVITLLTKLGGAVYCYRSCLFATGGRCVFVCGSVTTLTRNCVGLLVKVVTISSWLNFGRPAPPGMGSAVGRKFLAPPYYSQRAVFASLRALFHLNSKNCIVQH